MNEIAQTTNPPKVLVEYRGGDESVGESVKPLVLVVGCECGVC